jgi:hypothetical protein
MGDWGNETELAGKCDITIQERLRRWRRQKTAEISAQEAMKGQ